MTALCGHFLQKTRQMELVVDSFRNRLYKEMMKAEELIQFAKSSKDRWLAPFVANGILSYYESKITRCRNQFEPTFPSPSELCEVVLSFLNIPETIRAFVVESKKVVGLAEEISKRGSVFIIGAGLSRESHLYNEIIGPAIRRLLGLTEKYAESQFSGIFNENPDIYYEQIISEGKRASFQEEFKVMSKDYQGKDNMSYKTLSELFSIVCPHPYIYHIINLNWDDLFAKNLKNYEDYVLVHDDYKTTIKRIIWHPNGYMHREDKEFIFPCQHIPLENINLELVEKIGKYFRRGPLMIIVAYSGKDKQCTENFLNKICGAPDIYKINIAFIEGEKEKNTNICLPAKFALPLLQNLIHMSS